MVRDGVTPSAIPAWNTFTRNMLVSNYGADGGQLDFDDGSSWALAVANAAVYGGAKSGAWKIVIAAVESPGPGVPHSPAVSSALPTLPPPAASPPHPADPPALGVPCRLTAPIHALDFDRPPPRRLTPPTLPPLVCLAASLPRSTRSDFDGHSKHSIGNVMAYPQVYGPRCLQIGAQYLPGFGGKGGKPFIPGFADMYVNNTCILATAGEAVVALDVADNPLPPPAEFVQRLTIANNTVWAPAGSAGYEGPGGFKNFSAFQAAGYDAGSVVMAGTPDPATIIGWMRAVLAPILPPAAA
jgi:hypothetical protein